MTMTKSSDLIDIDSVVLDNDEIANALAVDRCDDDPPDIWVTVRKIVHVIRAGLQDELVAMGLLNTDDNATKLATLDDDPDFDCDIYWCLTIPPRGFDRLIDAQRQWLGLPDPGTNDALKTALQPALVTRSKDELAEE
jgi:hypothetical protein